MSRLTLPLLVFAVCVQTTSACSVPVFRYALEHWLPDPFMIVVFHRGELTDEEVALLEQLDARGSAGQPTANIMVKAIDVDQEQDSSLRRLWELQQTETLPWVAVHAPARRGPPQRIWGGQLTVEAVGQLRDSPARQEIARRLIDGDSVVWVLLESGDAAADEAAHQLLTSRLAELESTLRLPEIEEADFGELSVVPEALRMSFSVLRIAPHDENESLFITMLRHASGLPPEDATPAPTAIPVFGRGRAFDALRGDDVTAQTIEDACRFLTGACQCTVKSQNPGIDLLMAVDWDGRITPAIIEDVTPPPLVGLQSFAPPDDEPPFKSDANASAKETTSAIRNSTPEPEVFALETAAPGRGGSTARTKEKASDAAAQTRSIGGSLQRNTLLIVAALAAAAVVATLVLTTRGK